MRSLCILYSLVLGLLIWLGKKKEVNHLYTYFFHLSLQFCYDACISIDLLHARLISMQAAVLLLPHQVAVSPHVLLRNAMSPPCTTPGTLSHNTTTSRAHPAAANGYFTSKKYRHLCLVNALICHALWTPLHGAILQYQVYRQNIKAMLANGRR